MQHSEGRHLFSFQRNASLYLETMAISALAQGAYGVIQGLYILSLGFNEEVLGVNLAVRMLSAAIASVPAGIISDQKGRKPILISGGVFTVVGYLGMALSSSAPWMHFYSCLVGVAQACQATAGPPLLAESSSGEDRSRLFAVNFSLAMIVNMMGSLLGGFMPHQLEGMGMVLAYRISMSFFSLVTLVGVLPAMKITERSRLDGRQDPQGADAMDRDAAHPCSGIRSSGVVEELKSLISIAIRSEVLALLLYTFLIGFGAGLVIPYFNVFLSRKLGVDTAIVGLILSFSQGATALAGLLAPILANRYGKVATVVGTQVASVPFLLLIALPPNIYLVSFALFMRSALMNMSNPVASMFSMEIVSGQNRGKVSSLLRIADNLTRAASAVVAGHIMANWSYEVPYFFTAILYLLASVVYYAAFRGWERRSGTVSV